MITQEAEENLAAALREAGLDTVEGAFQHAGGEDLDKPGLGVRRRTRVELTDRTGRTHRLYLKRYGREQTARRLLRLLRGTCVGPSKNELRNIRAVQEAGVRTMTPIAEGHEADRLGAVRSYLVVTEVPGEALERCAEGYLLREGDAAGARLAKALGELGATLHAAGLVHRDFYASHIFLEEVDTAPRLWLIDLARVFRPRLRRRRWRVKDLAQLRYSMPPLWTDRHWDALLERYLAASQWRVDPVRLQGDIARKAESIARRQQRGAGRNADGDMRE